MSGTVPVAVLSIAIAPKTERDRKNLYLGLSAFVASDSALRVSTDEQTGQVVIAGRGEAHLEEVLDRLRHEFKVEAWLGRPLVVYKSQLTRQADGDAKYAVRSDAGGQYGHVKIRLYPGEPGTGFIFEDNVIGDAIPRTFIAAIRDGIQEALVRGAPVGYRFDDVMVELYDGSYHDVDSSEMAFRIAGSMAFEDAVKKADPIVLEPVMRVEVVVPSEHVTDVMGGLSARRGLIESHEDRGDTQVIRARVPMSELFAYGIDLRERTRGRAMHSIDFDRYQELRDPDIDEDDRTASVRAPRTPPPTVNDFGVALPEPDDDLET